RRHLRAHRHDGQLQGAEKQAARACAGAFRTRTGDRLMADVVVCECFARDGLQHEPAFVATERKAEFIERCARIGFERVEATSYSNPKVVPQFADASALLAALPRRDGVWYKATCANVRAVQRAVADVEQGIGV